MSNARRAKTKGPSLRTQHHVRDNCLSLHLQRAARAVARRFDDAFRPLGLTSGQFSLLMALSRPTPWRMGELAGMLAMDRTTLTANLKPLERRGLVTVAVDENDRRSRRLMLTNDGRALLDEAYPVWRKAQTEIKGRIGSNDFNALISALSELAH
jgi:DNA-binding MarR family transcriptional regulator